MNNTWNIGIIGAGMIADFHAMAINDIPNAHLIGFCDNGSGRSATLAKKYDTKAYTGYEELLNDAEIDLVIIATPSGLHMEPTILAAEKGIHVLCEKPLEITPARVDKMIQAHQSSNTYLGGIFNFRFSPVIDEVRSAIKEERMGKITFGGIHVPWWRDESYYDSNWKGTLKLDGGGALMNQSIHMVDLLQHLMGPVHCLCTFADHLHHDIEAEDTAVAILKFKNGALGQIYGTTASYPGHLRKLEISGPDGTICMEEDSLTVWDFRKEISRDQEILKKFSAASQSGGAADPSAMTHHNHTKNIQSFLNSIEKKLPFDIDGSEARKAVEIIYAIYESQKKGKIIYL